ncbi:MAG: hypothetical protein JWP09_908 [Candidatus Taylorbacteria bacterium]|nr:hypothetical protein [Candidatus Taylorbacteria bacterium]
MFVFHLVLLYTVFMTFKSFDIELLHICRRVSVPLARFGLFVVFFWFGFLKLFGLSPANPLVEALLNSVMPFMSFGTFIIFFGMFECIIGILFLIKGLERVAILMLFVHMITTLMPLFLLPQIAWSGFMIPTLEGQYMIKNILIIAAGIGIAAHLHPLKKGHHIC